MQRASRDAARYTKANPYHMINVWVDPKKREDIIKVRLLTDKDFKLSSLQVNPLYKKTFDALDAVAKKELDALDKSILWSRKYTKNEFKYTFLYPGFIFAFLIFCCLSYGVKYRLYIQHIKHGRKLGFSDKFDIDVENIEEYPRSVYELYKEKQMYDRHIERKEKEISRTEDNFHKFVNIRHEALAKNRAKRGLKTTMPVRKPAPA